MVFWIPKWTIIYDKMLSSALKMRYFSLFTVWRVQILFSLSLSLSLSLFFGFTASMVRGNSMDHKDEYEHNPRTSPDLSSVKWRVLLRRQHKTIHGQSTMKRESMQLNYRKFPGRPGIEPGTSWSLWNDVTTEPSVRANTISLRKISTCLFKS